MADWLPAATGLVTAVNPLVGGLASIGGSLTQKGGLFGGGGDPGAATSAATGTFTGGGLNITQADNTLKIGLIVAGIIVALTVWRKSRR